MSATEEQSGVKTTEQRQAPEVADNPAPAQVKTADDAPGAAPGRAPAPGVRLYWQAVRAELLLASVLPLFLGAALAAQQSGVWRSRLFLWSLVVTALIHAGANALNDYFDYRAGHAKPNRSFLRPFTDGRLLVQKGMILPRELALLATMCLGTGGLLGLLLGTFIGNGFAVLTLLGVVGALVYSVPPLKFAARGLGELTVGLTFGLLPVLAGHFAQTGQWSLRALLVAAPGAFLVVAALLIDEFQAPAAGKGARKRTLAVRLGSVKAWRVYTALIALAYGTLLILGAIKWLPRTSVWAAIPIVLALPAVPLALRAAKSGKGASFANALTLLMYVLTVAGMGIALLGVKV